jgi:hypothetical protein
MYGASEKKLHNDVIKESPLEWQKYANKMHPGQYVLKNWKEITSEEYKSFKKEGIS